MNRLATATRGYATARALATLETLAHGQTTVRQLAGTLGVGQVTARRLLQRLVLDGYAEPGQPYGHYKAAGQLRELGARLATGQQQTLDTSTRSGSQGNPSPP